jgi:hypothetical protein
VSRGARGEINPFKSLEDANSIGTDKVFFPLSLPPLNIVQIVVCMAYLSKIAQFMLVHKKSTPIQRE